VKSEAEEQRMESNLNKFEEEDGIEDEVDN